MFTRQGTVCSPILFYVGTERVVSRYVYVSAISASLGPLSRRHQDRPAYWDFIQISLEHSLLLGRMRLSRLSDMAKHG